VAREATARLYDVDEDSVTFRKLEKTEKYDQGTVTFRARKGKLIDLDQLHESIWASRLSGGTRSGLVSLDVTAIGHIIPSGNDTVLRVANSEAEFVLLRHPDEEYTAVFEKLRTTPATRLVKLSARVDDYMGRWPDVLRTAPNKPRRLLVIDFEVLDSSLSPTR
jgi:hypothetical protein